MRKALVVALSLGAALATSVLFLLIGRGVDRLLATGPTGLPTAGGPVTTASRTALVPATASTPVLLLAALACALASGICSAVASRLTADAQAAAEPSERAALVTHVFALGPAERTRERAGRLVSTATDAVERAAGYRETFLAPMIASMLTPILVVLVIVIGLDPVAGGLLAIAIPVVPLAVGGFQSAFRAVSSQSRAAQRALAAQELDAIQGLTTLSLLGAGPAMGRRLAEAADEARRRVMRLLAGNQLVLLVTDSVFSLGMVTGAVALALWRLDAGALSAGGALTLVLLSSLMLEPMDRIGQFFYIGMGGIAAGREIRSVLAQPPAVTDAPGVVAPRDEGAARSAGGTGEPARSGGPADSPGDAEGLRIEDVSFGYDASAPPVLEHADLEIRPGEHVVLTGASGAGKTTLAALIQAARRPDAGRVLIGGHDLATVPLAWARAQVGVVAQQTYLFTGTLRDNLLIAVPETGRAGEEDQAGRVGEARLVGALRAAHLDDLLARLPDGLDTRVGERGLALSGGEVQRVAIARALLTGAPILLLDEPTAHVDLASEREILRALDDAAQGRATLTISHRQATIAHADRRLELRDGRLVDVTDDAGQTIHGDAR